MLNTILFLGMPGGTELIVIVFVILLLFGGRKIPELARGIGKGIREFNSARANVEDEIKAGMKEEERKELQAKREKELKEKVKSSSSSAE